MSAVKTKVYSSFDETEAMLLHDFKKEVFYFTGEDLKNHNFWQQFYNLFFIYHYDIGDGVTLSQKRELEPASIKLFSPSVFSRMKGEDLFTGDRMMFSEDEENSLSWYKEKQYILSFFHSSGEEIRFVESQSSLLLPMRAGTFLKNVKKSIENESFFSSVNYTLFLLSVLMVKKERFSSSKLYDPFQFEEMEKLHLYYEKFAKLII